MYMYQRRRVDDLPASPAVVRSRHAMKKWKPQTAAKTRAAHPIWDAERVLSGRSSRTGCSSCTTSAVTAIIAAIEPTRQAQQRKRRRRAEARSYGSRDAKRWANQKWMPQTGSATTVIAV